MEVEKNDVNKENCESKRYTYDEDMALINYLITDNRYLRSSGIKVWKDAENLGICPGRSYLSMKERFRKIIVKNLRDYNVEKGIARKILEFMRASKKGKNILRYNQSSQS